MIVDKKVEKKVCGVKRFRRVPCISIYQDQFKINSSGEMAAAQISENSQLKEEIRGGGEGKRRGSRGGGGKKGCKVGKDGAQMRPDAREGERVKYSGCEKLIEILIELPVIASSSIIPYQIEYVHNLVSHIR